MHDLDDSNTTVVSKYVHISKDHGKEMSIHRTQTTTAEIVNQANNYKRSRSRTLFTGADICCLQEVREERDPKKLQKKKGVCDEHRNKPSSAKIQKDCSIKYQ